MKKVISAMVMAAGLIGSSSAMAQHSWPLVYNGTVDVQKGTGPLLRCAAQLTLHDATTASVTISPGNFLCATVIITSNPTTYSYDHVSGALVVDNVFANTTITPGNCAGNLVATKLSGVVSVAATLPAVTPGTGDCTINGTLN